MSDHDPFIRRAIELAALARAHGDEPFGALLVRDGKEILVAENLARVGNDPTNHAEMALLRKAWAQLAAAEIMACALYTSTEPCPMCAGAIFWSGIRRVVYSFPALELRKIANDNFCRPCREIFDPADQKTEIIGPILPEEGRVVHLGFWGTTSV